ncbi:MAG: hypothetical protein ACXACU_02900 [Candidatus Hodarchaeales archaeon]
MYYIKNDYRRDDMYKTNVSKIYQINSSLKKGILFGLVILLIVTLVGSYFSLAAIHFEGTKLGFILFPLFIFATIPILINFFYLVLNRLGLMKYSENSVRERISSFFALYYTTGLIFHSGVYTIVIGLVLTHMFLLIQQSTYCVILMIILGLIWLIEAILWAKNWPLYPLRGYKLKSLYWLHWALVFGLLIGLPFHVGTWSLFWMIVIPLITYIPLLWLIGVEILKSRFQAQKSGKLDSQVILD